MCVVPCEKPKVCGFLPEGILLLLIFAFLASLYEQPFQTLLLNLRNFKRRLQLVGFTWSVSCHGHLTHEQAKNVALNSSRVDVKEMRSRRYIETHLGLSSPRKSSLPKLWMRNFERERHQRPHRHVQGQAHLSSYRCRVRTGRHSGQPEECPVAPA